MGNEKSEKKHISAWLISLSAIIIAGILGALAWRQVIRYEEGILDIYAIQQDGYVQVVLNQINLLEPDQDTKIVENIIGTLDASSNKYWTLSKMEALIFVKDINETNRYKGFTTKSYYATDSAMAFIDTLEINKVSHMRIKIDEKRYIASGVEFSYSDKTYRICLLTSEDVILDHNAYLRARVTVAILAVLLLIVFILFISALSRKIEMYYKKIVEIREENKSLREIIERLNHQINKDNLYDTRKVSFQISALPILISKMKDTDVYPLYVAVLSFDSIAERDDYLVKSQLVLDKSVFRFQVDEQRVLLIFVSTPLESDAIHELLSLSEKTRLDNELRLEVKPDKDLLEIIKELM